MFRKIRSQYDDNQADTKKKRIWCILQLCVVCVYICWHFGYPFLGQLYEVKERILLFEYVTNSPYFEQLGKQEKELVGSLHKTVLQEYNKPFMSKAKSSIEHFFLDLPFFSKWWAIFALVLPILILLGQRGAEQASIILPFLAVCFAFGNVFFAPAHKNRPDEALFPSEQYLITHYSDSMFPSSLSEIAQQQQQLDAAWRKYLSSEWSKTNNPDEGAFFFTLERAKLLSAPYSKNWDAQQHFGWLLLYVLWNSLFAWKVLGRGRADRKLHKSEVLLC